jgi:NAD(P)-dependent dehydrogenase (short-subunit alcohol dehydrogenase family)
MSHGRFNNPVSASLAGVKDLFARQSLRERLTEADRLDGKTCLVTGANRGLGFAIATELARRGGHVIMACRSQIPEAGDRVKAASRSPHVEMMKVDLADTRSIAAFCSQLEQQGRRLDVTVLNAGITPPKSRPTEQGQDVMFMVNYLANFILVCRLLKSGVIPYA